MHARLLEYLQHLERGHLTHVSQPLDFNGAEAIQVNFRMFVAEVAQQVGVPRHGQRGIDATLHENSRATDGFQFGDTL